MKLTILALLTATAVLAQDAYTRAIYTKWKPGMRDQGQQFIKDVAYKASLNWVKSDPKALGQVTMSRVMPAGNEINYDRLRLIVTNAPPDLAGTPNNLDGIAMTPAEYSAKLASFMDTVRTEIWQSVGCL